MIAVEKLVWLMHKLLAKLTCFTFDILEFVNLFFKLT